MQKGFLKINKRSIRLLLTIFFFISFFYLAKETPAFALNCPDIKNVLSCNPGEYSWGPGGSGPQGTNCYRCDPSGTTGEWINQSVITNCNNSNNICLANRTTPTPTPSPTIRPTATPTTSPTATPTAPPTATPTDEPTPTIDPTITEPPLNAPGITDQKNFIESKKRAENGQPNFQSLVDTAVGSTIDSLSFRLVGCFDPKEEYCNKNQGQANATSSLASLIGGMYQSPPASSIEYIADAGQRLGLIAKPAIAAPSNGIGYNGLLPLLPLWKAFRNISYLLLTFVLITIGLLIIFRFKIDPKTAITVQGSLPRIFIVLLLITFSYAIAGFMIDLMYLVIAIGLGVFQQGSMMPVTTVDKFITNFQEFNVFTFSWATFGSNIITTPAAAIGSIVNGMVGGPVVGRLFGFLGSSIAALIIAIALIFALFKLWLTLLSAYIGIIIDVIFGPLRIMLSAIPGNNSYTDWFKSLLANISAFVVTAFMFILAWVLVGSDQMGISGNFKGALTGFSAGNHGWTPPFLGFGAASGVSSIPALVGLGLILLTPKVVDIVREALGVKPNKNMAAVGEALSAGPKGALTTGRIITKLPFGEGTVGTALGKEVKTRYDNFTSHRFGRPTPAEGPMGEPRGEEPISDAEARRT